MATNDSIVKKYLDFIGRLHEKDFIKNFDTLFSPDIKKIVNSQIICNNRNELLQQMQEVVGTYGIAKVDLLESITDKDNKRHVMRWEIIYGDNTVETIITILTCDDNGLIKEINEVFGDKAVYQWFMS